MASAKIAQAFIEHRDRLMTLVRKKLNPILLKRMSYEDVLQSAYEAAAKRLDYFDSAPDVPIYFNPTTFTPPLGYRKPKDTGHNQRTFNAK